MSKDIHANVSGTPTDTPRILDDTGRSWPGVFNSGNARCSFVLPDDATGGGHLRWLDQNVNFLLPATPGSYEGASLGLPTIAYAPILGLLFPIKGATEFNLPAKLRAGENIRPILQQRKRAGANLVRSLAMGFPFYPDSRPVSQSDAETYWRICAEEGLRVLWCVFANTRTVMPALNAQQVFWESNKQWASKYPDTVLLQLANEWNHGTQSIDPSQFAPSSVNLCDHGPGLTDAHPVEPFWSLVSWHPRRDGTRGITNYDCYEFEAEPWPRSQPWVPGEGAKPQDYGFNPAYAKEMGTHCGINWGGIFHSDSGIRSSLWTSAEEECARAFYQGVEQGSW